MRPGLFRRPRTHDRPVSTESGAEGGALVREASAGSRSDGTVGAALPGPACHGSGRRDGVFGLEVLAVHPGVLVVDPAALPLPLLPLPEFVGAALPEFVGAALPGPACHGSGRRDGVFGLEVLA